MTDTGDDVEIAVKVVNNANDRCDECGAHAYVFAQFDHGTLSWCGHHANEHWMAILEQATTVIDMRHTIGQR